MRNRKISLLLLVLLTSASLAVAASLNDVQNKIADKTKVERLQIRQENGKVILEGLASNLWNKTEAGKIAAKELNQPQVNNIGIRSVPVTDRELVLDVSENIRGASANNYLFNTLSVQAHNGEVILKGKLRDAYLKDVAVKATMKTPGVRGVIDQIELLPVSPGDDRLRVAIYQRLRSDGRLSRYFLSPYPSVNIIVENARVTLIGSVDTQIDKAQAGVIARETRGVLSVDNHLQVD